MKKILILLLVFALTGCQYADKPIAEEPPIETIAETEQPTEEIIEEAKDKTAEKVNEAVAASQSETPKKPHQSNIEKRLEENKTEDNTEAAAIAEEVNDVIYLTVNGKDKQTIFAKSEVDFSENKTVFDVLKEEMKKNNIIVSFSGVGGGIYVDGIDNLFEFDHGAKSGWIVTVNGVKITKSAGSVKVNKNDNIVWHYTLDLGNDIN